MSTGLITPGDNYDPFSTEHNTNTPGIVFLWVTCGLMVISATAFIISGMAGRTEKIQRFSFTSASICCIAAVAYMSMAFQQGFTRKENGRQLYYVRYIDWFLTTPLLLWEIFNLAGSPVHLTFLAIVLDAIMVVTGLFGALSVRRAPTWIWFGMGCLAFLPIFHFLLIHNRKYLNQHTKKPYTILSLYLVIIWMIYPIAWGLTDGGYIISVDYQHLWFAILDVISKCVFGAVTLFIFRKTLPYSEGYVADSLPFSPNHPDIFHNDREIAAIALPANAYNTAQLKQEGVKGKFENQTSQTTTYPNPV